MRVTVVGCSGSVPGPDSPCSWYLVEQDGFRLLLDLGSGSAGPLQTYVAPADVDAVVVSHAHDDHWSDLVHLGYLRTLLSSYRPLTAKASPDSGPSRPSRTCRADP